MSQALQRVAVRMLYDPALVDRIYAGEQLPELSAREHAWLLASPRAAWGTDPYRRGRTLQALLEEYPASATVTGLAPLHGFFAADAFHRCIQSRGRLALAFGAWLAPAAGGIAALELAIARARRSQPSSQQPGALCCAPGVVPITLPEHTVQRYQGRLALLGAAPLEALVAPAFRPQPLPPESGEEHWLLERGPDGGVRLGGGGASINALLEAAARPIDRAALAAVARQLGAEAGEEDALLDGLVDDGLLMRT